jgi:hypothetical protein
MSKYFNSVGIVGSEAAKFTLSAEKLARETIERIIDAHRPQRVVSGGCHLGGIDIWAEEVSRGRGIPTVIHLPERRSWSGGYKERNLRIATDSDIVYCITVKTLPDGYHGMRFSRCYHCQTDSHVKSGGCWTVKQAISLGKEGQIIVLGDQNNNERTTELPYRSKT